MDVQHNLLIPNKEDLLKAYDSYYPDLKTTVSLIEEDLKRNINIA